MALTPRFFMHACVECPRTRSRKVIAPDCTGQSRSRVGSRTMAPSAVYPLTTVVSVPIPPLSSPLTVSSMTSPRGSNPASRSAASA